ncbi:hypothetical protein BJ322DRAFT_711299 [Thelephora terrestris]|uniref:NB-ARC domain-containing protein n=1 Tax=Thelephora terrestris TaxID=56493 RepID=A0A9P6HHY8_9AGAM|nr:hypothetical protein BJ322DRAFT_711299 [Thelephora terrestris]
METEPQRLKEQDGAPSSLNAAIEVVNVSKDLCGIASATVAFGSVSALLTMIRDSMINERDYVELGLSCADICRVLDRGISGNNSQNLSQPVREAISQLTTTVADIQRKATKQSIRGTASRLLHAKNDKETIAAWKSDLNRMLHIFTVRSVVLARLWLTIRSQAELAVNAYVTVSDIRHDVANTHSIVSDIHRSMLKDPEGINGKHQSARTRSGELPPSPPRACFGRGALTEKIIGFAETLTPSALIGVGGIGKTSIALTVLHHDRIKKRFGENRRFLRCDQFSASRGNFLTRLSKVIGAEVENPEDLAPLRTFLSSKETIIVLDNAESILDPQGTDAQEIYALVEELSQLETVCLCITSRISTVPPDCETLDIPTLPMESARDAFYRIFKSPGRPALIDVVLEQLEFHPLSITLLATVAHHNKWDTDRLNKEWKRRRTGLLHTQHNKSLASAIELSLASPMFQELGSDARGLLGIVAFFPQGIDENNLEWLFPDISDGPNIFDKFCVLSLTYRSDGFLTMLAPLRDYLRPNDPNLYPLLCATKERYFSRLSVQLHPTRPGFGDARWITSEDANVEHLLDVFTTVDENSGIAWTACAHFMAHLLWHKPRLTVLTPKIEGLPDDHPSKIQCLIQLALLLGSVGNLAKKKRLLAQTLELQGGQGGDLHVARTLRYLAEVNGRLGLFAEGILQAEEALAIFERLDDESERASTLCRLSWLFYDSRQIDAAEAAVLRCMDLLPEEGKQFRMCQCQCVLGNICRSRGETGKAIEYFETALRIASTFDWQDQLFWNHYSLAELFFEKDKLDDAHAHVERAKLHAIDNPYFLGRATELEAEFWYKERRFEAAKSGATRAVELYEKLEATKYLRRSGVLLQRIEADLVASESDF